jgi:hypothetical protein
MRQITLQKVLEKLYLRSGLTKGESKFIQKHHIWLHYHLYVEKWDHDTYVIKTDEYHDGERMYVPCGGSIYVKLKVRGNTIKSSWWQTSNYRHDWKQLWLEELANDTAEI